MWPLPELYKREELLRIFSGIAGFGGNLCVRLCLLFVILREEIRQEHQ